MYVTSDPRAALKQGDEQKSVQRPIAPAFHTTFDDATPFDQATGLRTWYARAQNFVVAYTLAQDGSKIIRTDQPDEFAILLPDATTKITVTWDGTQTEVTGNSVVFIPAGNSTILIPNGGQIICFYSTNTTDIVARADALLPPYIPDENVPKLVPWPAPVDGFRVRSYALDVEPVEGRFGRIFRCSTFMINIIYPRTGPRDRTQLSPHKHDDFQQCSLCLAGTYVHHLRWPWETDANLWREDEHMKCNAPAVSIIPAGALHTSECVGEGVNQLIDVFCPPRMDFSNQTGWVLNADDYPQPA